MRSVTRRRPPKCVTSLPSKMRGRRTENTMVISLEQTGCWCGGNTGKRRDVFCLSAMQNAVDFFIQQNDLIPQLVEFLLTTAFVDLVEVVRRLWCDRRKHHKSDNRTNQCGLHLRITAKKNHQKIIRTATLKLKQQMSSNSYAGRANGLCYVPPKVWRVGRSHCFALKR